MAKKKSKTRTGALAPDTGAAEIKRKPKALKYFSSQQFISYKLVKGKHTIDLGTAEYSGKKVAIYLEIENQDEKATWSIDAVVNCDNYCQTRTIPNNVSTTWHHIPTNLKGTTTLKLNINTTSDHKEAKGVAKIKIY